MGKERQPFRIIRTVFVDSFDIAAEKTAQFLFHKVVLPVMERIVARIDPDARARAVKEIMLARYQDREPAEEAVEHAQHMPANSVKKILIDKRTKGR